MHLHWLILFLISLGRVSKTKVCNNTQIVQAKQALLEHLDLDNNKTQNARMWPLIFNNNSYINPAKIYVDLYVTSITNVNEKAQSLTTQVRMITAWPNRNLRWNYGNYCGIETFAVPKNSFWIPDIGIFESIDTEFGTKESPNVLLFHYGFIATYDVLSLTTACKMDLYKYPFDTQSCTITLQSTSYSSQEITFEILTNQLNITFESKTFQAQGEWELLSINCTNATMTKWIEMNQLIYQITIKRRPRLYVINIIVPVFFFLLLDVFSFFIDVNRQDKLNFKVTLLLSISVMLLLVNNTLPSTSEQIPLIGVYCSAIFCLIGISIVETILVHFMMDTGTEKRSEETTAAVTGRDDGVKDQQNHPNSVRDQNEPATRPKKRQNFCTRVARIIDVTFFVLYLITIIVFLSVLGTLWLP